MAEKDKIIDNCYDVLYNVRYSFNRDYGLSFITPEQYSNLQEAISTLRRMRKMDGDLYRVVTHLFKHHYDNFYKIKRLDAEQPRAIAQKFIGRKKIREFIIKRDKCCLRCGVASNLTIDHIIPISRGGENKLSNLQTLCKSCNSIKRDTYFDYRTKKTITNV